MERVKLFQRPQVVSLSVSSLLASIAFVVALSGSNVQSTVPTVILEASEARLNVVPARGQAPRPTASTLQGAQTIQQSTQSVDQAGNNASSFLQPNSGRNSFTEQDSSL
jgi:hypothetical protein